MNIDYTDHAEENIIDREINKEEIENAINSPDEVLKGKKGRKIVHKIKNGKVLRIVFEAGEKAYKVVTAHYAKKERYMKK